MYKVLVIVPNWLGDAIMATPALKNIIKEHPNCEFTLIGSQTTVELLKDFECVGKTFVDETKKAKSRIVAIKKLAKEIGVHDCAVTFRTNLLSLLLLRLTGSKKILKAEHFIPKALIHPKQKSLNTPHLVEMFNSIVSSNIPPKTSLPFKPHKFSKFSIGINAGATYGSAKRWGKFVELVSHINEYKKDVEFIFFGSKSEAEMVLLMTDELDSRGISNYKNLAGKTSLDELCSLIAGLDLFITNDSGPMHIASAYSVKTISIFGSTNYIQTCQWSNPNDNIIRLDLECMPCLERICPLKHHKCMEDLSASMVMNKVKEIL